MPRATGKDHARINLDIWGNDDWLDLTPPAQHLYFVLWTSPQLSYCGTGEWHPKKISAKAKGWTADEVDAAGIELAHELFLLIDLTTDEFILRSWIKHDGLWRTPNMAVSMANARADLASRTLRGVIVHEVSKLKARELKSNSWDREQVSKMLTQKAIDPTTLPEYVGYPGLNPNANPPPNPWANPPPNVSVNGKPNPRVNPPPNPGRTPAPAPTSLTPPPMGGYVTGERYESARPESNTPPNQFCPAHMPNGTPAACRACQDGREELERWTQQQLTAAAEIRKRELANCLDCDEKGWALDGGQPVEPAIRCPKHNWEHANA